MYINLVTDYATPAQLGTNSYREYLDRYVREVRPQLLSQDNYGVQCSQDLRNRARAASYFANLLEVRRAATAAGIPFWPAVSSNQIQSSTTIPSPANLLLQASTSLAAGAQGLTSFTEDAGRYAYAPIDPAGTRTATWSHLRMGRDAPAGERIPRPSIHHLAFGSCGTTDDGARSAGQRLRAAAAERRRTGEPSSERRESMSWRRGEIWLDSEVLWFRERPTGSVGSLALNAPSFFGAAPGVLAGAPVPNGLAESRQRRAELRRRRSARRTRAAALVIGPAAVLSLAGPRLGGGSKGGGALAEDPPSLTVRLGPSGQETAGSSAPPPGVLRQPRAAQESGAVASAPAPTYPQITWNEATSRGLPYAGSLSGGTQLPVEGPDWVTWNPIDDIRPNRPERLYGTERTIRAIVSVLEAHRAANPGAPRVLVGDISLRGGGSIQEHRSHQNGLDVDVYYPRLDRALRAPVSVDQVDRALAQDLVDRFVAAGAQMIFVGYHTGLTGPSGVVIPYPNHENHLHVRFRPSPR